MKTSRKLIWYVYPAFVVISLGALLALGGYSARALNHFYFQETQRHLQAYAASFRLLFEHELAAEMSQLPHAATDGTAPPMLATVDGLCKNAGHALNARVTVILASGVVIGDSDEDPRQMDNHQDRPEIQVALTGQIGMAMRYSYTVRQDLMYVALPVKYGAQVVSVVRAAAPLTSIQHTLQAMYQKILVGGLVVAALTAAVSLFVSYRLTAPLKAMQQGASRFARGDLTHKLHVAGAQEVALLAEALNQMATQLHATITTITQQRNELETMLSSMVEAVVVIDPEGKIVRCNQAAGVLFRCDLATVNGRQIQEVIRYADIHRFVQTTLANTGTIEEEVALTTDTMQFLRAHGTLLHNGDQRITGALLVFHDITRLKQLENMRRDFVANVSHELKTPITSIQGFVETLRDGAIHDPDNAPRFLAIIAKNANRLNAIIEDLLALSKIEQAEEHAQLVVQPEVIRNVLNTAIMVCERPAQEKAITIALDCPAELMGKINGELMEQAVINLLDNAIKYSEAGQTINVRAQRLNGDVRISVEDFGCGIPQEHLPRLFERFYRVDKARSRNLGGTGLGLAIVKHIVNAHHGRVTVDSTPGQGSVFTISLPGDV